MSTHFLSHRTILLYGNFILLQYIKKNEKLQVLKNTEVSSYETSRAEKKKFSRNPRRLLYKRLHVISSYAISTAAISTAAISTAAISTVYTFNRSHFQPLANSTACKFNRHKFDLFN